MRRIEKSTRALRIGDVFYLLKQSNHACRIVAQGPNVYVYVTDELGHIIRHDEHEDVWIDAPLTVGRYPMPSNELGRRLVACKHWRWMPGMLTADGERVLSYDESCCDLDDDEYGYDLRLSVTLGRYSECIGLNGTIPDLTDPATLGCLLHLTINVVSDFNTACYLDNITLGTFNIPLEMAEALVEALEAAP